MTASPRGLGRGLGSLIPRGPAVPTAASEKPAAAVPAGDGVLRVPIDAIVANPHQPREHFAHGDLDDLIASIKQHGILQPLVVTKLAKGGYELISGERRLRASRLAGLSEVPVVVRTAAEQEKLELALIENIQRADLNPMEEAKAYRALMDDYGLTQEAAAERLGKSRSVIANTVRLLDLPQDIQDAVRNGQIPATAARVLLTLKDAAAQRAWLKKMAASGMSVHALEAEVRSTRRPTARDPNLAALEERLRGALGAKVDLVKRGPAGRIQIAFFSDDELAALVDRLASGA